MKTDTEKDHAREQALAQLQSIKEMIAALDTQDDDAREQAEGAIQEDALSVEVRSDWYQPGTEDASPAEFKILLCTGGPACQIVGDLDDGHPSRPRLQYQDWETPWTELITMGDDNEALLKYCQQFFFQ